MLYSSPERYDSIQSVWTWLHQQQHPHPFTTPTLITQPAHARTVILRDSIPYTWFFFTDKRSAKCTEIRDNPQGMIHAYCSVEKVQFRMKTTLSLLTEHPKFDVWKEKGLQRFSDYGTKDAPGTLVDQLPNLLPTREEAEKNFCVIAAHITHIEILELHRTQHMRMQWTEEKNWERQYLIP